MNSTQEIYKSYISFITKIKDDLIKSIIELEINKDHLDKRLKSFNNKVADKTTCKLVEDIMSSQKQVIKNLLKDKKKLESIDKYFISYEVFKLIISTFNFEISKFILEGYKFTLPGSMKGKLFIREINNTSDTRVDWEGSLKLKAYLLKEGKEIYNKETNPTGIKWLVYHIQEFNYWWTWIRPDTFSNYKYFSFKPTNGCNTKERKQSLFLKNCTKKEDILNTTHLGNKDKLFALLKFDSSQFMKYRNNRTDLLK